VGAEEKIARQWRAVPSLRPLRILCALCAKDFLLNQPRSHNSKQGSIMKTAHASSEPWDEAIVREAIEKICADALAHFDRETVVERPSV